MRPTPPYSEFVAAYDDLVGFEFFTRVRRAFEALVPRYRVRFSSAADVGCGTGLFACYLSRRWRARVYAVDQSPHMLAVARARCRGPDVHFLRQDVRELRLPEPVDLVTANFDTLNHLVTLEDLRQAFRQIAHNLRPNAHLYFDLVMPCRPLGGGRTYRRTLHTAQQWVEQQILWEPRRRLIHMVVLHRKAGCTGPSIERHLERTYRPEDVSRALQDAGFVIRGVHDEASLQIPLSCPARILVIAQKVAKPRTPALSAIPAKSGDPRTR